MTIKPNTFDTIEVGSEAAIERCSTNAIALECCCSALVVRNLEKYKEGVPP